MISKKVTIDQVEYIVRAQNGTKLTKAIEDLYACQGAQLESRISFVETVNAEPAIETRVEEPKAVQSIEKQTPPTKAPKTQPKAKTAAKPVDPSIVDLGNIGSAKRK